MEAAKTPYEQYLRQSITEERARLDSLYNEFAKSGPLRKPILKRQIEEALQNIDLLSKDLDKYMNGLSWLREPSKERDEKAEHLPKLKEEVAAPAPANKPPAAGQPAKPAVVRPTIGKPIGSGSAPSTPSAPRPAVGTPAPRPTVGAPVSSRPKIGTPVGTPTQAPSTPAAPPSNITTQPLSRPSVGTPAKRPVIGTPIGTPAGQVPSNEAPAQAQDSNPAQTAPKPVVGTPVKRPIIGTPINKPKPTQDEEQQESGNESTST
jgi:hypothetical protein